MLTCKQVVRILGSEEPLTWRQWLSLRFHLLMCRHCSRFSKHLKMAVEGASKLLRKNSEVDESVIREVEETTLKELKKMDLH